MSGQTLEQRAELACRNLDLRVRPQFRMGRRIWGATRLVDLLVETNTSETSMYGTWRRCGLECKLQTSHGSAEEKLLATVADIEAWPIPGWIVLDGDGFSAAMVQHIMNTGRAVMLSDLDTWLRLFFRLELPGQLEIA